MHFIDYAIFAVYLFIMLGIGVYFMYRNKGVEDYYVGGRNIGSWHIGLSVVATDVGGGFSIVWGGLGFTMGLAGAWLLFTGLVGAWLAAVLLIPRVKALESQQKFYTFPQIFGHFYNKNVALLAGIISGIGYIGFTSSQILAGAKLASATITPLDLSTALIIMGVVVIVYTFMGGIQAVIYSDTIQWIILMVGLIFIGIPLAVYKLGGVTAIVAALPERFLRLDNISFIQILNWAISIIPIWFVGMTLYQRIYACRNEKEAKKAWFIAGLFEYPVMAFMGVLLGLLARVALTQGLFAELGYVNSQDLDEEMGLPILLRTVLPVGLLGLMLSAYFSAIMSTADSCLMAASGNLVTDILGRFFNYSEKKLLRISQIATLVLGIVALTLAIFMENVLTLMLHSYAFMVSGLLVPLVGALFWRVQHAQAALWAMLVGGSVTLSLIISEIPLWGGLDANIFCITASLLIYLIIIQFSQPSKTHAHTHSTTH
ncbi:MAG: sodium:solute symporter [Thermonemataceae bacterium]